MPKTFTISLTNEGFRASRFLVTYLQDGEVIGDRVTASETRAQKLGEAWMGLRKPLKPTAEDYVHYEQFYNLCKEHAESLNPRRELVCTLKFADGGEDMEVFPNATKPIQYKDPEGYLHEFESPTKQFLDWDKEAKTAAEIKHWYREWVRTWTNQHGISMPEMVWEIKEL